MKKINKKAFSMIEVMISIFVFTLGVMGVYAIIVSTMQINDYNKNYIIASNLAREQLELVRNIRDTNYKKIQNYNQIDPKNTITRDLFLTGSYYKIENNFNSSQTIFPVKVEKVNFFEEGKDKLNGTIMQSYKLCLDINNLYTYDCATSGNKQTIFYKYLQVEDVKYSSGGTDKTIENAIKITSKVIWNSKGYHSTEINTILADWKRL